MEKDSFHAFWVNVKKLHNMDYCCQLGHDFCFFLTHCFLTDRLFKKY